MPATITIRPWADQLIDTLGHDPRSVYVETFWLPTLGPTSLLLLRHLATRFDETPGRVELSVPETARALGLGDRDGPSSPLFRSLGRLAQFDLACADHDGAIAVRRTVPPINRRHLRRLPTALQHQHEAWVSRPTSEKPLEVSRRRARRLALVLLEQGDDAEHVERVLITTGFHPSICRESAQWAAAQREAAQRE